MTAPGPSARIAALIPPDAVEGWRAAAVGAGVLLDPSAGAEALLAAVETAAAAVVDPALGDGARALAELRRRHPGLPVIEVLPAGGDGWGDVEGIPAGASGLERELALRQVVEGSLWPFAGRGLSLEQAQLLARVRAGVLARISEHLTVILSHVDMLGLRLASADDGTLAQVREAAAACGRLVRETQAFSGRRQAVRCDLAALVAERRALYAVCAGCAGPDLAVEVAGEGPLWVDLAPAAADQLMLRLVLIAGHPALAMRVEAAPAEVRVVLQADLPQEREGPWEVLAAEVASHGGSAVRAPGRIQVSLPRDAETPSDDLLPHAQRSGEQDEGLVRTIPPWRKPAR